VFNIVAPGVTWKFPPASEVTVSYLHAFEKTVAGSSSIPPAFGGGEANVQLGENSLGIAFSHRFGKD
jgi:long-chain fatty acid transport protein